MIYWQSVWKRGQSWPDGRGSLATELREHFSICAFTCLKKAQSVISTSTLCTSASVCGFNCACRLCGRTKYNSGGWYCRYTASKSYPEEESYLYFPDWTFGCRHHWAHRGIYFSLAVLSCCWLPSCFLGSSEIRGGSRFNTLVGQQLYCGMFLFLFLPQHILDVWKRAY